VNVQVKEKRPFTEIQEINDAVKRVENELGSRGRLLLRYSGTEALARIMIEGEQQEQIDTQANELADVIKKHLA
jgi:phosphoglucosamine mutase